MEKPSIRITRYLIHACSVFRSVTGYPSGCCRFTPTCSSYACEALKEEKLPLALVKIIWRILRCNPFFSGGYDPVRTKGHK